jgi:hypothetical protein
MVYRSILAFTFSGWDIFVFLRAVHDALLERTPVTCQITGGVFIANVEFHCSHTIKISL